MPRHAIPASPAMASTGTTALLSMRNSGQSDDPSRPSSPPPAASAAASPDPPLAAGLARLCILPLSEQGEGRGAPQDPSGAGEYLLKIPLARRD